MKVLALIAIDKRTKEVIFVEGIEEYNTDVQVIIPRSVFSEEEILGFQEGLLQFDARIWDHNPSSDNVNLGDMSAFEHTCDMDNLKIEIIEFEVDKHDFINIRKAQSVNEVAILMAYDNNSGALLFAEGTDPDGYRYHQFNLDDNEVFVKENSSSEDFLMQNLGNEVEAKDIVGKYKNVTIEIKYVQIDSIGNILKNN